MQRFLAYKANFPVTYDSNEGTRHELYSRLSTGRDHGSLPSCWH